MRSNLNSLSPDANYFKFDIKRIASVTWNIEKLRMFAAGGLVFIKKDNFVEH